MHSSTRRSSRNRMYRWALRAMLILIFIGILTALVLLTSGSNKTSISSHRTDVTHRHFADSAAVTPSRVSDARDRRGIAQRSSREDEKPRNVYDRVCDYVTAVTQGQATRSQRLYTESEEESRSINRTDAHRQHRKTNKTVTVFFGDSVALQSLRLSALVIAHCWYRSGLLSDEQVKVVVARVGDLRRRIGDVSERQSLYLRVGPASTTSVAAAGDAGAQTSEPGDETNEVIAREPLAAEGGGSSNDLHTAVQKPSARVSSTPHHPVRPFVWELRFHKVKYFTQFATDFAVRRILGKSCATSTHRQVLMSGSWDMIRPTLQADKLTLEYFDFLEESDLWGRFLSNYTQEVTSAAKHLTTILNFSCSARRPVVVVPAFPNCSAPKFDGRVVLNAKKPDPYRFLKGPMCPLLIWQGTAWRLRQAMLSHASLSAVAQLVDADRLVTKTKARALGRFATHNPHHLLDGSSEASQQQQPQPQHDSGGSVEKSLSSCELTDGTHFDVREESALIRQPLLRGRYRCAFALFASLWDTTPPEVPLE